MSAKKPAKKPARKPAKSAKPTKKPTKKPAPKKPAVKAKPAAKKPAAKAKPVPKKSTAKKPAAKAKPAAKKPAPKKAAAEIMVNVTMWEPVQPLERGERYEDPLFAVLEDAELGGPGDGGGTLTGTGGEIEQIDFDVAIASVDAIPLITKHLEAAGAPKGSVLRYELDGQDHELMFGATEGIAIYLDGITQPAAIYESTSAQELVDMLLASLPSAQLRGSWQGPEETALYLYGADAEQMWTVVEPVLRDYPLSRNARVVVRHGNPANHPREVRLAAS